MRLLEIFKNCEVTEKGIPVNQMEIDYFHESTLACVDVKEFGYNIEVTLMRGALCEYHGTDKDMVLAISLAIKKKDKSVGSVFIQFGEMGYIDSRYKDLKTSLVVGILVKRLLKEIKQSKYSK